MRNIPAPSTICTVWIFLQIPTFGQKLDLSIDYVITYEKIMLREKAYNEKHSDN